MSKLFSAGLLLALSAPMGALAQTSSSAVEIQALRQEMQAMRAAYEARLQALEQRLQAVPQQIGATPAASVAEPTAPAAPPTGRSAAGANAFNPAIALILSGTYTRTSLDSAQYRITGFQLPADAEVGPGARGFGVGESELGLSASIDPWWRGVASLALLPENAVSVEEAYVQSTALGNGLTLKAGRFLSGVGYLNSLHAHSWDFIDNPLAYQALLGTQLGEDGVQLKWLAPTDQYLELGLEFGRGRGFPGSDSPRNGLGMSALTLHTGGDVGDSHSWRAGLSWVSAKADDQALSLSDANGSLLSSAFTGRSRVWLLDGVWKWAPNGNAKHTGFKLQGEYLHSTREGSLSFEPANINQTDAYRAVQSGWYVQGIYQFMPGWRVGLRTERLNPGTPDYASNAVNYPSSTYQPSKNSLTLDFSPSEFSRIRLQWAQDKSRQGQADSQLQLQYQMSLGAHGAHRY